jgi:hypothetical protein
MNDLTVGSRVRIERDETRYPSKGTWPQFRGKTGTIVEINLGEYGVAIGKTLPASGKRGGSMKGGAVTWFQPYEFRVISRTPAPTAVLSSQHSTAEGSRTGELVNAS